jgi:hypothetical protein
MVWCIAAVAKEEDIFVVGFITERAGPPGLFFFGVLVKPCLWVEFGNLLLVLNLVGGYECAYGFQLVGFDNAQVNKMLHSATYLLLYRRREPNEKLGGIWGSCWLSQSIPSNKNHGECGHRFG